MFCCCLFALDTLLCGLAPDIACFLAGRVMQGVGGGPVCSITAVVETDLIPIHKKPQIEGLANVAYCVGYLTYEFKEEAVIRLPYDVYISEHSL